MDKRHSIPNGFVPIEDRGPLVFLLGPFYRCQSNDHTSLKKFGFMPENQHTNNLGFMHGGMISTLLDVFMAQALSETHDKKLVTLNLNIEFHHVIMVGKWAEAEVTLNDVNDNLTTVAASLYSRNRLCASAAARFKLFNR